MIPSDPGKFADLPFLSFQEDTARPSWNVTGPDGETQTVTFDPVLWTSDFTVLLEAARFGTGVALLPAQVAKRALSERRLVRILPGWHSESVTIHLVFLTKRGLSSAVRVFINYVAAQFKVIWEERVR